MDYGFANGEISKRMSSDDKRLVKQHGLKSRPGNVDRSTRQAIWEARSKKLNSKRDKWNRHLKAGSAVQTAGTATAVGASGVLAAGALRDAKMSPAKKTAVFMPMTRHYMNSSAKAQTKTGVKGKVFRAAARAETAGGRLLASGPKNKASWAVAAGGGALAAAGGNRYRIASNKRKAKWSSASGGIASGAAKRMRDYSA